MKKLLMSLILTLSFSALIFANNAVEEPVKKIEVNKIISTTESQNAHQDNVVVDNWNCTVTVTVYDPKHSATLTTTYYAYNVSSCYEWRKSLGLDKIKTASISE